MQKIIKLSISLLIIFSSFFSKASDGIFIDFSETKRVKKQIQQKNPAFIPAYMALIERAELAMSEGPFSVMDKKRSAPSNNKHDYLSGGPYWWPDPNKANGLPYIRRDGEVNPEMRGENVDPPAKNKMMENVESLGWAYYFSGEKKYANKAIDSARYPLFLKCCGKVITSGFFLRKKV